MTTHPPSLTALSVSSRCLRGELLLSDEEFQQAQAYLESRGSSFRFQLIGAEGISEEGCNKRRRLKSRDEANHQDQLFKRLPRWAREIHDALTSVIRETKHVTPTYSAINASWPPPHRDPRHPDYLAKISPAPEPLSTAVLLMNLEQGHYRTPMEALNDVYNVWLCDFRYFEPGSIIWSEVYRRARAFQDKIACLGLDVEAPPKQEPTVPSGRVSNEEREALNLALSTLESDQHVELYEAFKTSANWVEVQNGVVELDDASTPPEVFRRMLEWCKQRAAGAS